MIRWLAHPLTRDLALDDPRTTARRSEVLRQKRFLRRLYQEWYETILALIPSGEGRVLELGAGAGFLREYVPDLLATEVFPTAGVDVVADAAALPLRRRSLRAIVMTNVLHHLPDPSAFLVEAARCLRPGGAVVMLEPWVTAWSRVIYRRLHHEPFDTDARDWSASGGGPLTRANGALPWMIFARDRERFAREHGDFHLELVRPTMPLRYLLSGGLALRVGAPEWSFPVARGIERAAGPLAARAAMFAYVVLRRRDGAVGGG